MEPVEAEIVLFDQGSISHDELPYFARLYQQSILSMYLGKCVYYYGSILVLYKYNALYLRNIFFWKILLNNIEVIKIRDCVSCAYTKLGRLFMANDL